MRGTEDFFERIEKMLPPLPPGGPNGFILLNPVVLVLGLENPESQEECSGLGFRVQAWFKAQGSEFRRKTMDICM